MKKNEPLKNNQPSMNLIEVLNMVDQLNNFYCNDCGNKRTVVKFDDLPDSTRQLFSELLKMPEFKNSAIYLYCKHCDEHAILGNPYKL